MKTTKKKTIGRETHTIDATQAVLGRLATRVATLLRGKHKVSFQPHIDGGDFVHITNASHITLTGQKLSQKKYYHYSGYPGGLKTTQISTLMKKDPSQVIRKAIYQMLPPNRLRKAMMNRLTIDA